MFNYASPTKELMCSDDDDEEDVMTIHDDKEEAIQMSRTSS